MQSTNRKAAEPLDALPRVSPDAQAYCKFNFLKAQRVIMLIFKKLKMQQEKQKSSRGSVNFGLSNQTTLAKLKLRLVRQSFF
jgi:hypothetical protein